MKLKDIPVLCALPKMYNAAVKAVVPEPTILKEKDFPATTNHSVADRDYIKHLEKVAKQHTAEISALKADIETRKAKNSIEIELPLEDYEQLVKEMKYVHTGQVDVSTNDGVLYTETKTTFAPPQTAEEVEKIIDKDIEKAIEKEKLLREGFEPSESMDKRIDANVQMRADKTPNAVAIKKKRKRRSPTMPVVGDYRPLYERDYPIIMGAYDVYLQHKNTPGMPKMLLTDAANLVNESLNRSKSCDVYHQYWLGNRTQSDLKPNPK